MLINDFPARKLVRKVTQFLAFQGWNTSATRDAVFVGEASSGGSHVFPPKSGYNILDKI
jgi:hypothetical protein